MRRSPFALGLIVSLIFGLFREAPAWGQAEALWGTLIDHAGNFKDPQEPGHRIGPVIAGTVAYYSAGQTLYQADSATGTIQRRILLPGYATALEPQAEGVLVKVRSTDPGRTWTRAYKVDPSHSEVPFFLSSVAMAATMSRRDAQATHPDYLEATAAKDPTNPWYWFELGKSRLAAGQRPEALEAFRRALAVAPEYGYELLAMVPSFDRMAPELADEAFSKALDCLTSHGFEPRLMTSLIGLMLNYGRPDGQEAGVGQENGALTPERLRKLAGRLERLAPHAEGVAYLFQAAAEAARKAGQAEAAARWESLAREALPYRFFGMASATAERTGAMLNLFGACLGAVLLVLIVKLLRDWGTSRAWALHRWRRSELVGLLLVYPVLFWASRSLTLGAHVLGIVAGIPLNAMVGSLGHPDALEFCAKLQGTPEGDFVYGLALQQAGEKAEAAKIYGRLASSMPEARQNLELMQSGRPGQLAIPGPEAWDAALRGSAAEGMSLFEVFKLFQVTQMDGDVGPWGLLGLENGLLLLAGLVGLIALAALARRPAPPEDSRAARVLELLVPGTARPFGVLGPLFLTSAIFSCLVAQALASSNGVATNVLEALAIPNIHSALGATAPIHSEFEQAVRLSAGWIWVALSLNVVVVMLPQLARRRGSGK